MEVLPKLQVVEFNLTETLKAWHYCLVIWRLGKLECAFYIQTADNGFFYTCWVFFIFVFSLVECWPSFNQLWINYMSDVLDFIIPDSTDTDSRHLCDSRTICLAHFINCTRVHGGEMIKAQPPHKLRIERIWLEKEGLQATI